MSKAAHAVVIGGSIAGLCAGRVLAEHFERVTVLERDRFPEGANHRKGVQQSYHPHALLHAGRVELERLFPGFERLTRERGALELNPGLDLAMLLPTGWNPRKRRPFTLVFASRVLIESVVRELARKLDNLELVEEAEVTGLRTERNGGLRATGVEFRSPQGEAREIRADLVVDASGRATKVPVWLEKLGLPAIETTVVDARAGYSSRWYQGPSDAERPKSWWWRCLWIEPLVDESAPTGEQRFGVLFPVENGCWIVTTASWGGELARDPESFERQVSELRTPLLAEAIARAKPISPIYARRGLQNSWRHYERWSGALPGFIATGDAVCGFNPVYGQGMSCASICAGVLEECLREEDPGSAKFARRFFQGQAEFLETPWVIAVSRDRDQAHTQGDEVSNQGRLQMVLQRVGAFYMQQIAIASADDDVVNQALFEVINLRRRPADLFRDPALLARVIACRVRHALTSRATAREKVPDYPPAEIVS